MTRDDSTALVSQRHAARDSRPKIERDFNKDTRPVADVKLHNATFICAHHGVTSEVFAVTIRRWSRPCARVTPCRVSPGDTHFLNGDRQARPIGLRPSARTRKPRSRRNWRTPGRPAGRRGRARWSEGDGRRRAEGRVVGPLVVSASSASSREGGPHRVGERPGAADGLGGSALAAADNCPQRSIPIRARSASPQSYRRRARPGPPRRRHGARPRPASAGARGQARVSAWPRAADGCRADPGPTTP